MHMGKRFKAICGAPGRCLPLLETWSYGFFQMESFCLHRYGSIGAMMSVSSLPCMQTPGFVIEFCDLIFKRRNTMTKLFVALMLAAGVSLAYAEPPAGSGPGMQREEMRERMQKHCAANPEKCAEMKERMKKEHEEVRAACEKDPAHCKEIRQEHREKMREKMCAEHPQECAEMKARHEEMKKQCAADPKACEEKKAQMREKMKERREERREQRQNAAPAGAPPAAN
ncbi:MAG: hypothetical protein HZB64_03655 [Rhodocyclales bacterium]|nr:hypothetical protein [Rhodocyclales bacterium]